MKDLIFKPPVIAHRGLSGYAPENTISAFMAAYQMGIKWVEFDVMQTADKQLIIFHDDDLERTTNGQGRVIDYSYQYLSRLDAGTWFAPRYASQHIPTLSEVFEFLKQSGMSANVEIKALAETENYVVEKTLQQMAMFNFPNEQLLFSSFSLPALQHLRKINNKVNVGLLLHEWEDNWEQAAKELNCISVHVNQEIMSADYAKKIKRLNKYLLCYTVNTKSRANELYEWGVDAVFSDVPDKILA